MDHDWELVAVSPPELAMENTQQILRSAIKSRLHGFEAYRAGRASFEQETARCLVRLQKLSHDLATSPEFLRLLALCLESRRVWMRLLVIALTPHCSGDRRGWMVTFVEGVDGALGVRERVLAALHGQSAVRETAQQYFENLLRRRQLAEAFIESKTEILRTRLGWTDTAESEIVPIWQHDSEALNAAEPTPEETAAGSLAGAWWVAASTAAVLKSELDHEAGPFPDCLSQHYDLAVSVHALSGALIDHAESVALVTLRPQIQAARQELAVFNEEVLHRIHSLFTAHEFDRFRPARSQTQTPALTNAGWMTELNPIREAAHAAQLRAMAGWRDCRSLSSARIWQAWMSLLMWDRRLLLGLGGISDGSTAPGTALAQFLARQFEEAPRSHGASATELDEFEAHLSILASGELSFDQIDPELCQRIGCHSVDDILLALLGNLFGASDALAYKWARTLLVRPPHHLIRNFSLRVSGLLSIHLAESAGRTHSARSEEASRRLAEIRTDLLGACKPDQYGTLQSYGALLASVLSMSSVLVRNSPSGLLEYSQSAEACLERLKSSHDAQRYFVRYLVDDLRDSLNQKLLAGREYPIVVVSCLATLAERYQVPFPAALRGPLEAYRIPAA